MVCVQGLLCQDQVLQVLAGVRAAAPGMFFPGAVPAQQAEQQNAVSSVYTFTSFPWRWGVKSDNVRICKTVRKNKHEIISQGFTSPLCGVNRL